MDSNTEPIEEVTSSEANSTETEFESPAADVAEDDGHEYVEVSDADEYWDAFDLSEYISDSSEEVEETDDAEGDAPAFPSEDSEADAENAELEQEADTEELDEEELLNVDLDRPAPLSRRKAERVVKGIIEPLRDPNTPIGEVLTALAEFHPTRTQQLAEIIVQESVQAYPDAWLQSITGLDVTVDQIREWATTGGSTPANTAPVNAENTDLTGVISELNELYGDNWKDAANDGDLLSADVPLARTVRAQLAQQDAYSALQQELEATRAQLGELKPQIDNIKTAQEAELEQALINTFQTQINEYREKIETNSIPRVLEAKGLAPKDSDPEEIKAVKQLVASRFQPAEGYTSDFDVFIETGFSGKDGMNKAIKRVANYVAEAAKLETDARRVGNTQQAETMRFKANSLREQAALEQDALTVWTRKAAAEFLETPMVKPILQVLERNAELQRRLNAVGRPEIVGQTAAIGAEAGLQAQIKAAKAEGVNPFDLDISGLLGGR